MKAYIDGWDLKVGITTICATILNHVDADKALQLIALFGTIVYTGFSIYEKSQMIRKNRKRKDD